MSRDQARHGREGSNGGTGDALAEYSSSGSHPPSPSLSSSASSTSVQGGQQQPAFFVPSRSDLDQSKAVRFLIQSPSSESHTIQTIFMPQDNVADVPKFGSASKWKMSHLELLNVEYDPQTHFPFTFDSVPMSPALHARIPSTSLR